MNADMTILVAYDLDRVIGNKNMIPWHLPADLKAFKARTVGHTVIMGRKTWESIPMENRPLPSRFNFVISHAYRPPFNADGPFFVKTIEEVLQKAPNSKYFVIGGEQIYRLALRDGWVKTVIATEIKDYFDGDAHFVRLPESAWRKTVLEEHPQYNVVEYKRTF